MWRRTEIHRQEQGVVQARKCQWVTPSSNFCPSTLQLNKLVLAIDLKKLVSRPKGNLWNPIFASLCETVIKISVSGGEFGVHSALPAVENNHKWLKGGIIGLWQAQDQGLQASRVPLDLQSEHHFTKLEKLDSWEIERMCSRSQSRHETSSWSLLPSLCSPLLLGEGEGLGHPAS